jgi:hypothetical protein
MPTDPLRAFLTAIETTTLAETLRVSSTLYPLVNALHILGIALLVGGIVAVDLRVIGLWRGAGWREAVRDRAPIAGTGLALAMITGALLFSVHASAYANNPAMLAKWAMIVLGLIVIAVFHAVLKRTPEAAVAAPRALRALAAASIAIWVAALFAGRWIAFVE